MGGRKTQVNLFDNLNKEHLKAFVVEVYTAVFEILLTQVSVARGQYLSSGVVFLAHPLYKLEPCW